MARFGWSPVGREWRRVPPLSEAFELSSADGFPDLPFGEYAREQFGGAPDAYIHAPLTQSGSDGSVGCRWCDLESADGWDEKEILPRTVPSCQVSGRILAAC